MKPARVKYHGRDWCGHCANFEKGTWAEIVTRAGGDNKRYFIKDSRGPSPVGYFPSFTVNGSVELGKDFAKHMRNYEVPFEERVDAAISGATDPAYIAALEILKKPEPIAAQPDPKPKAAKSKAKLKAVKRPPLSTQREKKSLPPRVADFIGSDADASYGYGYNY